MTWKTFALAATTTIGLAALGAGMSGVRADDDKGGKRVRPVTDQTVIEECGACHMVFQPAMLPARSWVAVMNGLADHFGENAALSDDKVRAITDYLVANAGDAGGRDAVADHRFDRAERGARHHLAARAEDVAQRGDLGAVAEWNA
ncbi:MAG TPA: hypothetical protein PLJ34_08980, partial [Hyphomicrobiales bacterium]|nr:hypothetical protein [Hyphomicrobiales bacterium]